MPPPPRTPAAGPASRDAAGADLPGEVGFLAGRGMAVEDLRRAAALARRQGTDAATVLLHGGLIHEETFYRTLADRLGVPFLEAIPLCPRTPLDRIAGTNAAPLAPGAGAWLVAAPRGRAVARLLTDASRLAWPLAITTPTLLREAMFARHAEAIAGNASEALRRDHPEWSCRPGAQAVHIALAGLAVVLVLALTRLPGTFSLALVALAQLAVLATLTIRLGAVTVRPTAAPPALLRDRDLPVYTVLVALHREAAVVPRLIRTLGRLDYPPAKLDLKFLIETGDTLTEAALRAAPLPARFEIVVVPPGLPRTKPRALNAALPFARGDHLVVYDAEDVIDPGQLRLAATRFAAAPATTACLQGHLVIDNVRDSWLTRFFAIEYAALFEVLGPALARWRMPTPLGGTSTHFRTRVLRELYGWDAWNVTEDADLGLRLALAGYHVGDLPSATQEEAPHALRPWLRQRTRWMKGFLQTSVTHWRRPVETCRRLGARDSLAALTLVPGTVLSALLYPFLTLATLLDWWRNGFLPGADPLACATEIGAVAIFALGTLAMMLPGALGCWRRGWPAGLAFVPLLPLYFALVSLGAWLAVLELARHPHRWNKTEHGLSRTSLSGALPRRRPAEAGGPVRSASPVRRPSPAAAVRG